MLLQLGQRLIQAAILLFVISLVGFALLRLLPGDFAEVLLLAQMDGTLPDKDAIAQFTEDNGFNDPALVQYWRWLSAALSGDLGQSFITGETVVSDLSLRVSRSLMLGLASLALALFLAIPIGFYCAIHAGNISDRIFTGISVIGMSIPNFWLALLMALLFSLFLNLLPSSGHGTLAHIILPALVIATSITDVLARFIRSRLLDELSQDYVRTAKAKGLSRKRILWFHAVPNILPSTLTLTGLQFARVFDGMIVVETIFAWPGIGSLLVESLFNRDYPLIQMCFLVIASGYVVINFMVDYLITLIDPRVRGVV